MFAFCSFPCYPSRMLPDDDWVPPMDHAPGWKASAFSWDMGRLILARVAAGETVKAITADPRMPSYCTVYRWVQMHPRFGAEWRALRERIARAYVRAQDTRRAAEAFWAPRKAAAAGKRWWRRGKPSSYTRPAGVAICARLRGGETMMAIRRCLRTESFIAGCGPSRSFATG